MKTRLEKVYSKLPKQKVDLRKHKIALGLVDNFNYDYNSLEDQSGLLSYLAYEWHDEKFEEYRQAWMALNDEYKNNASAVLRYDDVSNDLDLLNEIKSKAEELGLEAYEVYPEWDIHIEALSGMKESDDQYKKNEDEFNNWS